ncbi:unnamed protein product [Cylicocyclus nassatus]|uniref:Methyltransferase FkbM domain-containing protein n=1 Tax=Cylicocyclus nassatus TaxID=53992 RepID=A0AA36HAI4_CYLNA|nr:unnamed protein product [Cylicocyclus nassatus]
MAQFSVFLLLSVTLLCTFFLYNTTDWSKAASSSIFEASALNKYKSDLPLEINEAYDEWHKCMSDILYPLLENPEKLWSTFRDSVGICRKQTVMKKLNLTGVKNKDEFKYHLYNTTDKTPSVVITLGVGWDVLAEKTLKTLLPNGSLFFGADPVYETNDKLYSTVGTFFPIAVGNETKVTKAFVMPKELKGDYEFQTMVHIDVITFLTKLTRTPFIDQFLMDNEGPEYDIIPMMGVGNEFDQNGLAVCQINAEIHHIHEDFKERFASLIKKLLSDRRYAILDVVSTGHHRTFLLNFGNKKCAEKYLAQFFR